MELRGRILQVLPPIEGVSKATGNPWKAQGCVMETIEEQYPKRIYFELFGADRIMQNPCNEGDIVTVSFDIDCHEYLGKWYTRIRAYRVIRDEASGISNAGTSMPQPSVQPVQPVASSGGMMSSGETTTFDSAPKVDDNSDLPF